jgi:C-terminal processing protease CtpA/Prc
VALAFRVDLLLTPAESAAILRAAAAHLARDYFDLQAGRRLAAALDREASWQVSGPLLAAHVTALLQREAGDRHLRVWYTLPRIPAVQDAAPTSAQLAEEARLEGADGFGITAIDRIGDDVGYIRMSRFAAPEWAGSRLASAMDHVSGAAALIIDLRDSRGGSPDMTLLVASYLFDRPVHLVTMQYRDRQEERWTQAAVRGPRYPGPVFLLVNGGTFSAAEGLAYHLRQLGRATIVGSRTRGGANPGVRRRLSDHLGLFVPMARAVNPASGTNWEGTGVTPDIAVDSERALDAALAAARRAAAAAR